MSIHLIVSPFFYPEPVSTGKYNTTLARALQKTDPQDVVVICSHPIFPKWIVEPTTDQLEGVHAIRGGSFLRFPKSVVLRRAILEVWFLFHVISTIAKLRFLQRKKIATAIFIFPPSLMALGAHIVLSKSTRRVGIVHDLQAVYAALSDSLLKKLIYRLIVAIERRSFRLCESLIFLSVTMKNWAIDNYRIEPSRTSVQYPFVNVSRSEPTPGCISEIDAIVSRDFSSIVYSGGLGEKQAPDALYSFFDAITCDQPGWRAYIFSSGPEFERLRAKNKSDRIIFAGLVPESGLGYLLKRSDIQVIPQSPGSSEGSLPSKFPNIVACKTKLLCITDESSELASLVAQYPLGTLVHCWENSVLVDATLKLAAKSTSDFSVDSLLGRFDAEVTAKGCLHPCSIHA